MKLLAPLGLLGLIGLALLILIYILKPDFKERVVPSTYIWKLSLKYRKKKSPWDWLRNSLLLLLQVLAVLSAALMLAQPAVVVKSDSRERIIIVDASASMLAKSGGGTRFDAAREEALSISRRTVPHNKVSVILASDNPAVEISRDDRMEYIEYVLAAAKCSYADADMDVAMALCGEILSRAPGAEVIFITDSAYEKPGAVTVVNIAENQNNAAILDFKSAEKDGYHTFSAEIASYGKGRDIPVILYINGERAAYTMARCGDSLPQTVTFTAENARITDDKFVWAKLEIEADDAFEYDNRFIIYRKSNERFKVQCVSDYPERTVALLSEYDDIDITLHRPSNMLPGSVKYAGYDLYIFENYTPRQRPADGSVWLIKPSGALPADFGLKLGSEAVLDKLTPLTAKAGGSQIYREVMSSALSAVDPRYMGVTQYTRAVSYEGYERLLYCEGNPVFFAKSSGTAKTFILTLDAAYSDFSMIGFPLIGTNIIKYTLKPFTDQTVYSVGERITAHPQCGGGESVALTDALGAEVARYDGSPAVFVVDEPGAYTLRQEGEAASQGIFVRVPEGESAFRSVIESPLTNPPPAADEGTLQGAADVLHDIIRYVAAGLLALVIIEWGLQYREQY